MWQTQYVQHVVDMVDAADTVDMVSMADRVDLQMWWTCGRGGLVDVVDLWTRWNWWTVDAIKELGMERKDRGCVVVT